MYLTRPIKEAEIFEGIQNCVLDTVVLENDFTANLSVAHTQRQSVPVQLVFESLRKMDEEFSVEIPNEILDQSIAQACEQYLENIFPERIEDRFEGYLLGNIGLSKEAAISLYEQSGIAPFILLERIFISEPLSSISFDFECYGESYLEEYGFSFDLIEDRVEFVTPRGSMPEGSYPASRQRTQNI